MLFRPLNPVYPPHHHEMPPAPPHHHGPRHSMVAVMYNPEKLAQVYGDSWAFHIEKIAKEPPEMKILFALEMGFKIAVNKEIMESMDLAARDEPAYKFTNPSLDGETLGILAHKLGIESETVAAVLGHTHDGVVAVIIAAAKK